MSESKKTYVAVDSAITEHIQNDVGDNLMVVGWVVSVATKEIGNDNFDANGFAHFTSESFPEYSQLGLLQTVLDDKRNTEIVQGIGKTLIAAIIAMNDNGEE
jgi:hypothetical protein